MKTDIYDCIVIGSGPAGAVTGDYLVGRGYKVLMLESGTPNSAVTPFGCNELQTMYKNSGMTFTIGNSVSYAEGQCLGGGSQINAGLYHQTPQLVLKKWVEKFGIIGLSDQDINHHFSYIEKRLSVQKMLPEHIPSYSMKLFKGASSLGWDVIDAPRWFKCMPGGEYVRQGMDNTFIMDAIARGLTLVTSAEVSNITFGSDVWTVGWIDKFNHNLRSASSRYLFVCAGAVNTPSLLLKNKLLRSKDVPIRMHPSAKIVAKFNDHTNSTDGSIAVHQVKEFYPNYSFGGSISTLPHLQMSCVGLPDSIDYVNKNYMNMGIYYAMTSVGNGRVLQTPFSDDPLIRYRISSDEYLIIKDGLKNLARCLFEAGAVVLIPVVSNSKEIYSYSEFCDFIDSVSNKDIHLMTIHLMGSCPMGKNETEGVVDSYGKLFGFEGLYVNDASIFCTALGVNPQGTVMMLARRNSERFAETH